MHRLRHAHATELINAGVSIEAVRRRLGHAGTETTQLYAPLDDKVADAEIRAARRRRDRVNGVSHRISWCSVHGSAKLGGGRSAWRR
ncbi:tyrosine-type recombinase/integrase [Streptosporangium amethystogenes subsp. fukuiense]|uniref:Tyrosine-type recombinase/integrase n=1 Tax=Streptosporangium amethystogenes subsp. fukuiense TaxID=698418 RepID=A0ABW2SV40_9ACTN